MRVIFYKHFEREIKKVAVAHRVEVKEKIELFISDPHHPILKTHKLTGQMKDFWSFSVNFRIRIIFEYLEDGTAAFLSIGDHSIYD